MAEEGLGQNGPPRPDQWLPLQLRSGLEKGEKRPTALGSGALHFIRTRSSIRRELKRHSNQSKIAAENTIIVPNENYGSGGGGGGGGGLGKWLREHLGGSRGNHEVNSSSVKRNVNRNGDATVEKSVPRLTYASQNLYCSLPREHGRPFNNSSSQKLNQLEIQGQNSRPRSNSANYCSKINNIPPTPVPPVIRRGGPVYSTDVKSIRRRNRDRRRHSLNETLETLDKRVCDIMAAITHGKVKLNYLRDEIDRKKNVYVEILESVQERREELSTMRSRLSITRKRYLKKRETAGLMLALPTLREMERIMDHRDFWKQEIDNLRSLIFNSK